MRLRSFCIVASILLSAAGCGGGGGGASNALPVAAPGGPVGTGQLVKAKATLVIPSATHSQARTPRFVSPSANGVQVITYAHTDTNHTTALATVVTDVSSSSTACSTNSNGRTCTVGVQGPTGSDDFVFNLYDTAPAGGAIPNTAKLLGTAGLTQTLVATGPNVVTATIGGVIASLGTSSYSASMGTTASIAIAPTDFGNHAITGASPQPYANPITVSVIEYGGSNHAKLSLNGGTGASNVTVSKSTDTVQVLYDGSAASGYYLTVTLTAAAVGGQGGATQKATLSPIVLTTVSTEYTGSTSSVGMKGNGDLVKFAVSEYGATPTFTFTRGANCAAVGMLETLSNTAFNIQALGVASTYAANTGCAISVSDGTSTVVLGVSNTYSHTFAGATFSEFSLPATYTAGSIGEGPDGNMWFEDYSLNTIGKISTSGVIGTLNPIPSGANGNGIFDIASGPDGNVWFSDCSTPSKNGKIPTTYAGTGGSLYPTTSSGEATALAAGPDGNMWFSLQDSSQTHNIAKITPSGTVTEYETPTTGIGTCGVTEGPDANMWFTECNGHAIVKVTTNGVMTEYPLTDGATGSWGITAGPDGALWFTEQYESRIERFDLQTHTFSAPYATPTANRAPYFIVTGQDGALWFTEDAAPGHVGRITTSGISTEYAIPSSPPSVWQMSAGPDGNIWFAECGNGKIGKVTI